MESKKDLKKLFPHLFKELEGSENKVKIDSIRKDPQEAEAEVADANEINPDTSIEFEADLEAANTELDVPQKADEAPAPPPDKFRNYNPTVVDFLRRCDTCEQAEEIITYMCKKGELTEDHASQLRTQLKKDGVRSFGPKKETDYYFKESGLC